MASIKEQMDKMFGIDQAKIDKMANVAYGKFGVGVIVSSMWISLALALLYHAGDSSGRAAAQVG